MTYIYVLAGPIAKNCYEKKQPPDPVIVIDRDGVIEMARTAEIQGPSRVTYSQFTTRNGSHVWVETESDVIALD